MIKETTAQEVEQKVNELTILDVREESETAAGMIPGALNIPLGQILTSLDKLDQNKEYTVVCRSGNRSSLACEWLNSKGFKVTNMNGGMMAWTGETV
ncbi:Rhodanese-related sulfurtransferase [Domibacillus enclensis]|uniref:Rhodanese-related sulfurtransferase n=1 Tax=Domibacillus enclensis TaxID=1017273 RepID=A0A1N7BTI4_9BACI|nr:rhodanese-like domain-containing protein [Domibacillus enclensis]SIR54697.1 Rhodanese-related sulfurtransferase [Domibacillus enclensis]